MESKNRWHASEQLRYWWAGLLMMWARTQTNWIVRQGFWWVSRRRKCQN